MFLFSSGVFAACLAASKAFTERKAAPFLVFGTKPCKVPICLVISEAIVGSVVAESRDCKSDML